MNDSLRLENVFNDLISKGFDLTKPMKWNFYFINYEKPLLDKVVEELKGFGYTFNIIKESKKYKLIASKTEILIPEKLNNRIIAFVELAEFAGVDSFDGWDVEYS